MLRLALLLLALLTTAASAQVVVQSDHPMLQPLSSISSTINTAGPIIVTHQPCGTPGAFWDRQQTIIICKELTDKADAHGIDAVNHGVSVETAAANTAGKIVFVFLHELAHALIQRHNISFTGREEDAADQFAAWSLIMIGDPQIYIGATNFFAQAPKLFGTRYKQSDLTGEHSLHHQRRAQLVCWGYGKSPGLFSQLANHIGITQHRLQRCQSEYQHLIDNTPRVFAAGQK